MSKEDKIKRKKQYLIICLIIIAIVIIDQFIKIVVVNVDEDIIIIKDVIELKDIKKEVDEDTNTTVAISSIFALIIIFRIISDRNQFISAKLKILISLAFAGGLSNIIDRVFRGRIIEYISILEKINFNIADICILIGWLSFVWIFASFTLKEMRERKNKKETDK